MEIVVGLLIALAIARSGIGREKVAAPVQVRFAGYRARTAAETDRGFAIHVKRWSAIEYLLRGQITLGMHSIVKMLPAGVAGKHDWRIFVRLCSSSQAPQVPPALPGGDRHNSSSGLNGNF